jgi:hypothetical protein
VFPLRSAAEPRVQRGDSGLGFQVNVLKIIHVILSLLESSTSNSERGTRAMMPSRIAAPQSGIESSFSFAMICTTRHWIPAGTTTD